MEKSFLSGFRETSTECSCRYRRSRLDKPWKTRHPSTPATGNEVKPRLPPEHRRLLAILGGLYVVVWSLLARAPHYPTDWWMENVLIFFGIGFLLITGRWFVFSKLSYTLTFVFLCLHTLGAHYTYSEVPYREWLEAVGVDAPTSESVPAPDRNQFDRAIHFLYGLFITWPYREAFYYAVVPRRAFWSYLLPLSFSMATSLLYELLEWAAAIIYGGELGMAFLGTQGDIWDAHKDMLLAAIGSLLCFALMLVIKLWTGRDFAREWGEKRR